MADFPRSLGTPLDHESALARSRQVQALTDPIRLRILSEIAAEPSGHGTAAHLAGALSLHADVVLVGLQELENAGLVSKSPSSDRYDLTADAWVRFGRLLTGPEESRAQRPMAMESPTTSVAIMRDLPPVVRRITRELSYRFSAYFSAETVEKYVAESYWLLADRAKVTRFLPSLTSQFATDRLAALATANGLVLRGTPEVLFVCVQNAGRSQMAAAILRFLAGERVHVRTAGSAPASMVHPAIIEALDEIGVPLAAEFPKPLTDEVVQAADYVITMGCGDACPIYPGRRYMDWVLEDPVGKSREEIRLIRDEIVGSVRSLIDEMGLDQSTDMR